MQLRRFNEAGQKVFAEFLDVLRADGTTRVPVEILEDSRLTLPLSKPIAADPPASFANRMAFAQWLDAAATAHHADVPRGDAGFWAWLALALFDHVCPTDAKGSRQPGANPRHLIDGNNWQRRYRHLLQNAYELFYLHRDNPARALVALINPLHKPGELTEQINGRKEIVTCPGCMSLATFLCVDPAGNRRKGASGDFAAVFGKMIKRLSRTWDLPVMAPTKSAELLRQRKLKKLVDAALGR